MPGQPRARAVRAELTRRALEELGENTTPLDYAARWIANGGTIASLARDLTAKGFIASRECVRSVLYSDDEEDAEQRLAAARARGAGSLVEEAMQIVDAADTSSREELAKAKLRSEMRVRVAGFWNRSEYGEQRGPQVQINVQNLHIGALRNRTLPAQGIANPLPSNEEAAQVLEVQEVARLTAGALEGQVPREGTDGAGSGDLGGT